jgi:2-polyprenyl-3-methyl-5-hydroxy-6-metoxy-1,4-benzoquinol methylase
MFNPLHCNLNSYLIDTIQTEKLIHLWRENFDTDISDELSGIKEICLHRCPKSQLDFFTPFAAEGSEKLYRQMQKFDWFYMKDKWEFYKALKDLADCQTILEVGCGPGFFIEQVQAKLKGSRIKGIELNSSIIDQALEKNLPVECVDLNELVAKGEMFDAVCSFQVLEHTSQPRELIEAMINVLKPGGKLIVSVPNKDSFLRHVPNHILDMPPHHMTRWNLFTFRYLEKLFPLKLTSWHFEPLAHYHFEWYVSTYAFCLGNKLPYLKQFINQQKILKIANFISKSGLYRFIKGHTLYVSLEKL